MTTPVSTNDSNPIRQVIVGVPLFILGVTCSVFCVGGIGLKSEGPRMHLAATALHFKEMSPGEEYFKSLAIRNAGDSPLVIEKIVAGCSCTATSIEPTNILQPGEVASLEVAVTVSGSEMRDRETSIAIWTNEPRKEMRVLPIRMSPSKTRPLFVRDVDFGNVRAGQLPLRRELHGTDSAPVSFSARFNPKGLKVQTLDGCSSVEITSELRDGEFFAIWKVEDGNGTSQDLKVRGNLRGDFFAVPSSLAVLGDRDELIVNSELAFERSIESDRDELDWSEATVSVNGSIRDLVTVEHTTGNCFSVETRFGENSFGVYRPKQVGEIVFSWSTPPEPVVVGVPVILIFDRVTGATK